MYKRLNKNLSSFLKAKNLSYYFKKYLFLFNKIAFKLKIEIINCLVNFKNKSRKVIIKNKFISKKIRLFFINVDDLSKLSEEDLNINFNINSLEELGYYFLNESKKNRYKVFNFHKSLFCFSCCDKDIEFYLEKILKVIENCNLNWHQVNKLFRFLPEILYADGKPNLAAELMILLKIKSDKLQKKGPSITNENSYFTAIGHSSLVFFLLQAINTKLIDTTKTPISLIYDKIRLANYEYSELIADICEKFNVKLVKPNHFLKKEDNLEIWPIANSKKYLFSRHFITSSYQKSVYGETKLILKIKEKHKKVSKEIFERYKIDQRKWFVGMHLRTEDDHQAQRNADLKIYQEAIDFINEKGGNVILIGTKKNKSKYADLKNCIDSTKFELSRFESESFALYVWSYSRFFIGSLSGGTFPPINFNTPIIWLDYHPTNHFLPPNPADIVLPKKVYYIKEKRFLSYFESQQPKHTKCQSENTLICKKNGYELFSVSKEILQLSISKMLKNTSKNSSIKYIPLEHPDTNKYIHSLRGAQILES